MRLIRRIVSILGYLWSGMFLIGWIAVPFLGDRPDLPKTSVMAFTALFSLVPLGVSALISPGRRLREIGIVLVVGAGWTGAAAASFAILAIDPKFMALMPPDTKDTLASFDDPAFGAAFTIAMGGLGLWLIRRRDGGSVA